MTPIADMVEQMLADGAKPSLVVLAIRAIENVRNMSADSPLVYADNSDKRRREADRDRKRRDRALRGPDAAWTALAQVIIERDKNRCNYCGAGENLTADHIVPLSRGGTNDPANLCACCRDCNLRKRNRTAEEWLGKGGKQTMSASSDTSTGQSANSADNHCDLSSASSSVKAVIEEGSKEKKKEGVTQSARGTRMIEGAQITPKDYQFAIGKGMAHEATNALWVEFVDFWIGVPGQRGVKSNWPATWRNRVRTVGANGRSIGQGKPNVAENRSLVAAARRASDSLAGASGVGDRPSEPVFRIISQSGR